MSAALSEARLDAPGEQSQEPPENVRAAIIWMVMGAFAFSIMGACTFAVGSRCDWLVVATLRAVFMCASTAVWARAAGVKLVLLRPKTLWVRSFAGSFSLVCNFYAMTKLAVADVMTITNTYPLWIVIATAIALKKRPTGTELLCVLAGLMGVVLIQQPQLSGNRIAALVALLSSFSTTVAMLGLHRLKHVDARAVVVHFAGVAAVIGTIGLLIRRPEILSVLHDPTALALLAGVGISGTIGQVFLTKAYASGAPTKVSVAGLTQVVFGLCFDVLFWHRSVPALTLLGMALILTPTAWVTSRAK